MQITAASFSDPTLRPQLQAYYDSKKAAAIEAFRARENEPLPEATLTMPGGGTQTVQPIQFTAGMVEKMLVPFDKWAEFQAQSFDNGGFGPKSLEMAQNQLDQVKQNHPDTSSDVRKTFASNGTLLAYINADGTIATANGSEKFLNPIIEQAEKLGLTGEQRIAYLGSAIEKTLGAAVGDLQVSTYSNATSPTKREFADMWYQDFDIDQHYADSLASAQETYDSAKQWYDQWQSNMNDMRNFILNLQEQQAG